MKNSHEHKMSICKYINNKHETVMLHGNKNDAAGKRQCNSTWNQESCSAFKNEHEESSVVVRMQLCNLSRKIIVSTGNQCFCRGLVQVQVWQCLRNQRDIRKTCNS